MTRTGKTAARRRRLRAGAPVPLLVPALLGLAFLVVPLIALLVRAPWRSMPELLTSAEVWDALRLSLVVAIGLGALPLLFAVAPDVAAAKLLGVSLPWLLLGVASFPFLVLVGWAYVRLAERNEQDFTDLVRRPER